MSRKARHLTALINSKHMKSIGCVKGKRPGGKHTLPVNAKTLGRSLSKLLVAIGFLLTTGARTSAQGTAFMYQGHLAASGLPATGSFDITFNVFSAISNGANLAGAVTNKAVYVNAGLFTVNLDFGHGVFTGNPVWLELAVRTNGAPSFTTLTPRQPITPAPYAIFATTASNLSGTINAMQVAGSFANSQLANNSITVSSGPGLSGGGTVALGGTTTLTNTGVLGITGNGDITATAANGTVTLGSTANTLNVPGAILKRDGGGNFSAGTISLSGKLNMANAQNNTGVGGNVLANDTTGSQNSASGFEALFSNTSGNNNTASGFRALYASTIGNNNTANGYATLYANTTGSDNTAIGYAALYNNATGSQNTAIGKWALTGITTGSNNTAIGYLAGYNAATGDNNIFIGNIGASGDNNVVRIGSGQDHTYIAGAIAVNGTTIIDATGKWVGSSTGLVGPQGPAGPQGPMGPMGLQGPAGPAVGYVVVCNSATANHANGIDEGGTLGTCSCASHTISMVVTPNSCTVTDSAGHSCTAFGAKDVYGNVYTGACCVCAY